MPIGYEIQEVLKLNVPLKLTPEMSHTDFAKNLASNLNLKTIWVYENGVLLNNKPFSSFALAMVSIGYSKSSVAARRSIDTGKIIGGKYTFYSNPL